MLVSSTTDDDVEAHVDMVMASLPASDVMLQQIVMETEKDPILQKVTYHTCNGWTKGSCPQFYPVRADLSVAKGLVLRQNRIVIPQSMRQDMLHRIHEGHLGIEKCKRRAREAVYWPGINRDIETMIERCDTCLRHHYKQTKEPMLTADLPNAPWQKVGTDLFHLNGKDYLLLIDYYSNYPEVAQLSSTSALSVITHMKGFFARHGIPQCVVSDNGPQYNSEDFRQFVRLYGFQHLTPSPLYPRANGQAEKGVQIVKRLLKKASDGKTDFYLALLSYRAAPLECGASPAELLMGRKLRTTLPHVSKENNDNKELDNKRMKLKLKQKTNYDKVARRLEPLREGDVVRIEDPDSWTRKATVLSEVGPRSFTVKTENGQVLRRNRKSLLRTQENTEDVDQETESEKGVGETPDVPRGEPSSPSPITETPALRRSMRPRKPPDRLIAQ